MAVQNRVLAHVRNEISRGFAAEGQVVVGTDGRLDDLRGALAKIFYSHTGEVLAQIPGDNALLVTDLSREGLSEVAALRETQSLKPSYLVELER